MNVAMRAAQATGDHWGSVAKACLESLGPPLAGANLGLIYVTAGLADDLPSIVTFLREKTHIQVWAGAVGYAVFGPLGEICARPALSVLTARLPEDEVCTLDRFIDTAHFRETHGAWLSGRNRLTGLIHGDPRDSRLARLTTDLADAGSAFLIGGIAMAQRGAPPGESHFAGRTTGAALSGLLFGDKVDIMTSLTQGCIPIGPAHRVSEIVDNIVIALDGQPALDILKQEAGGRIAEDLQLAAGLIHVALPVENSDTPDYVVRGLLGVDPRHGWIAIASRPVTGDRLMFVRRDPEAALDDMRRMLTSLARRLDGRPIRGGVYISCVSRGPAMFGEEGCELAMIHQALGEFPLIGFAADGELFHDRVYAYTGVLTLFL